MSFEELKRKLIPVTNKELFKIDDSHARDEWAARNAIRFCNVYSLRDGVPVATVAICAGNINDEEAIRQAIIRLSA